MASPGCQELVAWAKDNKLTEDIINVLNEEGFTSLNEIRQLSPQDLKDIFLDQKLMRSAQYVRLKKAVEQLNDNPQPRKNTDRRHSHETEDERYTAASCLEDMDLNRTQPFPGQVNKRLAYFERDGAVRNVKQTTEKNYHERPRDAERTKYTEHPPERSARSAPCTLPETLQSGFVENFRLLLIGKTGSGKSCTGNTILGENTFKASSNFNSVSTKCEKGCKIVGGRRIEVVDSPGLFDTLLNETVISGIIMKTVVGLSPGPDAIIYVIKLGRFTEEEHKAYNNLKSLFDENFTKYVILLFTCGDDLEYDGKTFDDMKKEMPKGLLEIRKECSDRCIVFNNRASNKSFQVEQLLEMVKRLKSKNGGRPYSCSKYSDVEKELMEEVERTIALNEERELEKKQGFVNLKSKFQAVSEDAKRQQEQTAKLIKDMKAKAKEEKKRMEEEQRQRAAELSQLNLSVEQRLKAERELREEFNTKERELAQDYDNRLRNEIKLAVQDAVLKSEENKPGFIRWIWRKIW